MKNNKETNSLNKYMLILLTILVLIVLLDYFNIPSLLKIKAENFNMGFLNIIINSIIIVFLYLVTYKVIDKRNIKKSINKENTCNELLLMTYKDCLDYIDIFDREEVLKIVVKQVDFNAPANENKVTINMIDAPFENKDMLINLAIDGEINERKLAMFFDIKKAYRKYIYSLTTFFDHKEIYISLKDDLIRKIKKEIKLIKSEKNLPFTS